MVRRKKDKSGGEKIVVRNLKVYIKGIKEE